MTWCNVDLRWAYGDLLHSINRHTRNIDRSYDVLHDSLVRLALINHQEPILQPHAYLRTVVQSVLARHGKDAARWMPFPDSDERQTHPDLIASREALDRTVDPDDATPSPEHMAYLGERLRALQRVLNCLPRRCGDVFFLYRVEGLSHGQISERLGISRKTVEYHLKRALVDLALAAEELR